MTLKTLIGITLVSATISAIATSVGLNYIDSLSEEDINELLEEKTKPEKEEN